MKFALQIWLRNNNIKLNRIVWRRVFSKMEQEGGHYPPFPHYTFIFFMHMERIILLSLDKTWSQTEVYVLKGPGSKLTAEI
jgi:hypothetical protein